MGTSIDLLSCHASRFVAYITDHLENYIYPILLEMVQTRMGTKYD